MSLKVLRSRGKTAVKAMLEGSKVWSPTAAQLGRLLSRAEHAHRLLFFHCFVPSVSPPWTALPTSRAGFSLGFTDPRASSFWKHPRGHAQKYDLPILWATFNPVRWTSKIQHQRALRRWSLEDSATVTMETGDVHRRQRIMRGETERSTLM